MYKHISLSFKATLLSAVLFPAVAYADLPFEIVPDGTLPTEVSIGSPVSAAYEVSNNTRYARSGNFVLSLPPNVVLDPSVGNGDCGTTFDLAAKGSSGDSCILNLLVSGAVNGNDPDPSNHLFVCMSDRVTCAGTAYPLNVTVSDGPTPPINQLGVAVGAYGVTASPSNAFPLILNNIDDNNLLWEAVPLDAIEMPTGAVGVDVKSSFGVACNSEDCTAVGIYEDSASNVLPLILNSDDVGNTSWIGIETEDIHLPAGAADSNEVTLSTITCLDDCTAAGTYAVDDEEDVLLYPLILNSEDNKTNWTGVSTSNISLPSDFLTMVLNIEHNVGGLSVECRGTTCILATTYDNNEAYQPLILKSSNGGNSWAYTSDITLPPDVLPDQGSALLNGVTCAGTEECIAVGSYVSEEGWRPLILNSNDGGDSWTGVRASQIDLPASIDTAGLYSVTCVGEACTAVGIYDTPTEQQFQALILNSNNGGASWVSVDADDIHLPSDNGEFIYLFSVVCTSDLCTAVGGAIGEEIESPEPLILNSTDGGATWYAVDSDEIELPDDTAVAVLSGLG